MYNFRKFEIVYLWQMKNNTLFVDREDAAEKLVPLLENYKNNQGVVVLGLPHGGLVLAKHVADKLNLPLDFIVVRKVVVPTNVEFAIGAVTEDKVSYFDWDLIKNLDLPKDYVDDSAKENLLLAKRKAKEYRKNKPMNDLHGKTAIIVDDGIVTGATMHAAIGAAKMRGASRVVVAVPIATKDGVQILSEEGVEVECPIIRGPFWTLDDFYSNFPKLEDGDVLALLRK